MIFLVLCIPDTIGSKIVPYQSWRGIVMANDLYARDTILTEHNKKNRENYKNNNKSFKWNDIFLWVDDGWKMRWNADANSVCVCMFEFISTTLPWTKYSGVANDIL